MLTAEVGVMVNLGNMTTGVEVILVPRLGKEVKLRMEDGLSGEIEDVSC